MHSGVPQDNLTCLSQIYLYLFYVLAFEQSIAQTFKAHTKQMIRERKMLGMLCASRHSDICLPHFQAYPQALAPGTSCCWGIAFIPEASSSFPLHSSPKASAGALHSFLKSLEPWGTIRNKTVRKTKDQIRATRCSRG